MNGTDLFADIISEKDSSPDIFQDIISEPEAPVPEPRSLLQKMGIPKYSEAVAAYQALRGIKPRQISTLGESAQLFYEQAMTPGVTGTAPYIEKGLKYSLTPPGLALRLLPKKTEEDVRKAVAEGAAEYAVEPLTSPFGVATAGAAGLLKGIVGKAAGAGFAAMSAPAVGQSASDLLSAIKARNIPMMTKSAIGLLSSLGMAAAGTHAATRPTPKIAPKVEVPAPIPESTITGPIAETRPERLLRKPAIEMPAPESPPQNLTELELFLEQERIRERQTVPEPVKRPVQEAPPIIGEEPKAVEWELITPEKYAFEDEMRRISERERLPGEFEGTYPPTAEQLGTFQSREFVPELSELTGQAPEIEKLPAKLKPPSTPLVTAEQIRASKKGIIAGSVMEEWANRVYGRGDLGTLATPQGVAAWAVREAAFLEREAMSFADWSARMVKEHGPEIKAHLEAIWDQAQNYINIYRARKDKYNAIHGKGETVLRPLRAQPGEGEGKVPVGRAIEETAVRGEPVEAKAGEVTPTEGRAVLGDLAKTIPVKMPEGFKDLPPVPEGHTRIYHGEGAVGGAGSGQAWGHGDPDYVAKFGKDMYYMDVPNEVANAARQKVLEMGKGTAGKEGTKGYIFKDELVDWTKNWKKIEGEATPEIQVLDASIIPEPQPGIIAGSPLESWANNILAEGRLASFGSPKTIAAIAIKEAAFLEREARTFASFTARMIREHGPKIKPYLQQIWDQSQNYYDRSLAAKAPRPTPSAAAAPPPTTAPQPSTPSPTPPTPPQGLQSSVPAVNWLRRNYKAMGTLFKAGSNRKIMTGTFDASDNMSKIAGQQARKGLEIGQKEIELEAATAVREAKGDRNNLQTFLAQSQKGGNKKAEAAVRYAINNWDRLQDLTKRAGKLFDDEINFENLNGIDVDYTPGYVPHIYDTDLLMGTGRPFVISGRRGLGGTAFKKGRTFNTIFDAIEMGYTPKTLNIAHLAEHRIRTGQQLINRKHWADGLKSVYDPTDQLPIVTDLIRKQRASGQGFYETAPWGFVPMEIIPGHRVAVHEAYLNLFRALNGTSAISSTVPGQALLRLAGGIKHGLLVFDTYHASRISQKELVLTGKVSYGKGQSLLEYADRDLARAVNAGLIPQEIANWVVANRPTANLLIKAGLNVGRIHEALFPEFIRKIWGLGTFNKWVFEKLTRGAMMESGLIEFERVKNARPDLSDVQVARQVARDLNFYFGNIGRQGIFKSQTMLDMSRLVGLAPQWVESMAQTETRGMLQTAKGLTYDPIVHKNILIGTLGKGIGQGLLAYFIGTQILNLATRRQFTWQNEEEGHKLDAWIPDVTGKSKGFFLSPFSVVAELTHDAIRYSHTEPSKLAVAARIASNKLSPIFRAGIVLLSGEQYDKRYIVNDWNRIKAAGIALAPTPIPASPILKGVEYPGQIQRQLTASMGVKTEPAPTASTQIRDKARRFMESEGKKRDIIFQRTEEPGYGDLRNALRRDDKKEALKIINRLLESHKEKDIRETMKSAKDRAFTSKKLETKFKDTLTDKELDLYDQARQESDDEYQKFLEVWEQVK